MNTRKQSNPHNDLLDAARSGLDGSITWVEIAVTVICATGIILLVALG